MLRKPLTPYTAVIAMFVIMSAILFWWSYSDTYFAGDETLFSYQQGKGGQWLSDENPVYADSLNRISSVGDVFVSQAYHWRHGHGRNLITAVEQVFSGAWPTGLFYVINTLVWVYSIWLTIWIGVKGRWRGSLWIWLLAVVSYFFLFPGEGDLFTSINYSTNYLWPIAMTLSAYALWRRYGDLPFAGNRGKGAALAFVMLILAWSHEAWCLPMSATLIVWYLWIARSGRRTLGFAMSCGYWVGSLILLASPGNYMRTYNEILGPMTEGVWPKIQEMCFSVTYCNIFWVLVLTLAVWGLWRPRRIWDFIVATRFWWILGVMSMAFVMVFHTTERSFTGVDMVSLVLLLKFIPYSLKARGEINVNRWPWLAVLLMAGAVALMGYVARLQRAITAAEKEGIDYYIADPDGLAVVDYPDIPAWAEPWVRCKLDRPFQRVTINWELFDLNKTMKVLNAKEYRLLSQHPEELFSPENRIGQSPFYTVDGALSAWSTDSTTCYQFWAWDIAPGSFNDPVGPLRKLGRIFLKPIYSSQSRPNFVEPVRVDGQDYYRIDKYSGRGLLDAHFVR